MGALEDQLAANAALRRNVEDYITEHVNDLSSDAGIAVRFRVSEGYVRAVRTEMAAHSPLPRHGREEPEVLTSPVEVLDHLVFWLASPAITSGEVRQCLTACQQCRNHLLYLLDTAPYTEVPGERVTARLKALPEVHEAHGPDGPDQDRPGIRWISP